MNDLVKELNLAIGALRAHREYFGEDSKLLVDNSIPGLPTIMPKARLLEVLHNAEIALDKVVCQLSGYPWVEKKAGNFVCPKCLGACNGYGNGCGCEAVHWRDRRDK